MPDQPEIRHARVARLQQAMTYAGLVHLDADEISVLALYGLLDQRIAIAETDFENDGRVTPEHRAEIERRFRIFDAIHRPQLIECALLRRRHAPGTQDETANRAPPWARLLFLCHRKVILSLE